MEWLEHNERYHWVKLEADGSGFLDDILVMRADDVLEVAQVKYSTAPYDSEDAWTWERLLAQNAGKKATKPSDLKKWFDTWRTYVDGGTRISPSLISNRRAGDDLLLDPSRGAKVTWNELPDDTRQRILAQLGDETEVHAFFDAFRFRVNQPSLRELERGAWIRFERLGGTLNGWYALEKAVREWVNTKDNPRPGGRITLEHVKDVAKLKPYPVALKRFLPPSSFFQPYLDQTRLFQHCLPQVGQRPQLKELLKFVSGHSQLLILCGRGGSGKSKLIHTLCRRLTRQQPDLSVRMAAENLPIEEAALKELPDDKCLVIVDDAQRIEGLPTLLAAARQHASMKILLVTRPYATDFLTSQIVAAGFDRTEIITNPPLPDLNYSKHQRQLARLALGRDFAPCADELAFATRDSPLLTVLGAQLLRTENVRPDSLTHNERFRQEILARFRDITIGRIISQLDARFTPELCANLLPFIAALSPFDVEFEPLLKTVAGLLKTDEVKLKQLIDALVKGGALVRGRKLVRIVPDVLSDFILEEACFTSGGTPTGWANQAYYAVADFRLDVVLRNLAELDWRVRTGPSIEHEHAGAATDDSGLLDSVWQDIYARFRASTLRERKSWLGRIERLALIQPERMWPLIEIALNEPAIQKPNENSSIRSFYISPTTEADVISATIPILRAIAHHDRFTERCANLLWEMGRDLETEPGHSPSAIEALRELASYQDAKSLAFSHIVLSRCRDWINDPNIFNYRQSILTVIAPMLARQPGWTQRGQGWHTYKSFALPPDPFKELRRGALKLVERCALSGIRRVTLGGLETLIAAVGEEGLWGLEKNDLQEWQKWEEEQLAAIDIVDRVAVANDDPFVRLRIWEVLHWQAACGLRSRVKDRARQILKARPLSFESRFILLMTDKHGLEEYDETLQCLDHDKDLSRRNIAERSRAFALKVAREWVDHHPDPSEGFDAFDKCQKSIETSGWWTDFWTRSNSFVLQLARDYPEYARAWCEIAPEKPESRTTGRCDDLLCELRFQDQRVALELAQRFLEGDHPNLCLRVAGSYWRGWPAQPLSEEIQIVRDLLAYPNASIRSTAARIVSDIAAQDLNTAMDLILQTDIGSDSNFANNLFEMFEERRGFDFAVISTDRLIELLGKINRVDSVRPYHLGQFLAQAALITPVAVATFLLERVKEKVKLNKSRFQEAAPLKTTLQNLMDEFGGLPRSAFYDEKFRQVAKHPEYKAALRVIRDAALSEEYYSGLIYEDTLSELFSEFSLNYSLASLEVLDEWINSDDCDKVKSAIILLGDTSLGFYVAHLPFVSNYLRRANQCGKTTFEEVEHSMLHCARYGPPRGMASARGERSNALFHNANNVLEKVQGDSLTLHFFRQLRDTGQEMIRAEMREVADEEVFFRA